MRRDRSARGAKRRARRAMNISMALQWAVQLPEAAGNNEEIGDDQGWIRGLVAASDRYPGRGSPKRRSCSPAARTLINSGTRSGSAFSRSPGAYHRPLVAPRGPHSSSTAGGPRAGCPYRLSRPATERSTSPTQHEDSVRLSMKRTLPREYHGRKAWTRTPPDRAGPLVLAQPTKRPRPMAEVSGDRLITCVAYVATHVSPMSRLMTMARPEGSERAMPTLCVDGVEELVRALRAA
jgi:hypothetical protein